MGSEHTRGTSIVGAILMKLGGGAGVVPFAGTPVSGGSGTYANTALGKKGSILLDTTNGVMYLNTGTQASPVWTTAAGNGQNVSQVATLDLTNAQIKALRATPVQIVAAPGAGFVISPDWAFAFLKYGGTNAFTGAANDNLSIKLKDGSGAILLSGGVQAWVQATNSALSQFVPGTAVGATPNIAKSVADNMALVVHNQTAGEIAGNAAADNLIRVVVGYSVLPANSW
jgi:hypothetical protein